MKKEASIVSMAKLIMVVSLIVALGAVMGTLGYFWAIPRGEVAIDNIQQKKFILEKGDIAKLFSQETQIIETQFVKSQSGEDRAIVLWMIDPEKIEKKDDFYTCPETTKGSYYQGQTRISLVDLEKMKIINTIKIISSLSIKDEFYVPYQIRDGVGPYFVREKTEKNEGKPTIIKLKDYNEDGKVLEFAFFDSPACISPLMTIIGYSENKDEIIQYDFNLEEKAGDDVVFKSRKWLVKIFLSGSNKDGYWESKNDTCGRGGVIEKSKINYNQEKEIFEGELEIIDCSSVAFADWQTYRNEEYGFELRYPLDWKYLEGSRADYLGFEYEIVVFGKNIPAQDEPFTIVQRSSEKNVTGKMFRKGSLVLDINTWGLGNPEEYSINQQILSTFKFIQISKTEILSPSTGEVWKVGESYDILWKPKNENNRIDIRLYNNDASDNATRLVWQPSNVPNTGKYTFDVFENMKNGNRYQLEITEYDDNDSYNVKSGEFSIVKE